MKKNFFKKLSFVLALAMIVSVLAPAAGVFAASKPKLNATKKYLYLDVDGKNAFNFDIANKGKGWKYSWDSSNEKVAKVNGKNGVVTATGAGSTKITVFVTDKDGEEKATLNATVVVRDNIKEVTIANKPADGKVAVGVVNDFNRTYVTVAGKTKGSESVTRWTVEPTDGATIDDSGKFVATKTGKYTVKAWSFQSLEKYNTWKADAAANAALVLDTDSTEVTVAPSMKSAKQVSLTKAEVTFDTDMSKTVTKDNLKVYKVVTANNTEVQSEVLVKEIKFDTTGTIATVETYVDFVGGENYKFVNDTLSAGFVAAKVDYKEVVKVELGFSTIEQADNAGWSKTLTAKLFNAAGVDITTSALADRVTFAHDNTDVGYLAADNTLTLWNKGDIAKITATFHTYDYDTTTYEEIVIKGQGTVTAIDKKTYNMKDETEWTVATTADWNNKNTKISTSDDDFRIFARVQKTDDSTWMYSDSDDKFTFSSSDENVLVVQGDYLYPVKEGTAVILCRYDGVARATFNVTVYGDRKTTQFSIKDNKNSATLSNSDDIHNADLVDGDRADFELVVKDQTGKDINTISGVTVEGVATNNSGYTGDVTGAGFVTINNKTVTINGESMAKGAYNFLIKYDGKTTMIKVQVNEPTKNGSAVSGGYANVDRWDLTLSTSSVDTHVETDKVLKNVTPYLNGYAQNGVLVYRAAWGTSDAHTFSYEVFKGTNEAVKDVADAAYNPINGNYIEVARATGVPATVTASGPSVNYTSADLGTDTVNKMKSGVTYTVYAKIDGTVKGTRTFTVVDNTKAATVELQVQTLNDNDYTYLLDAVRAMIKVRLDGSEIADDKLFEVTYSINGREVTDSLNNTATVEGTYFIKSVKFIKKITDTVPATDVDYGVTYTVNVNKTLYVK